MSSSTTHRSGMPLRLPLPGARKVDSQSLLPHRKSGARLYFIEAISNRFLEWLQRARERRQLDSLGDHMLKDLGVSRADVECEICKPFWRR